MSIQDRSIKALAMLAILLGKIGKLLKKWMTVQQVAVSVCSKMKNTLSLALGVAFAALVPTQLQAHCQVPCGIYADDNVFVGLEKDVETISKAMKMLADDKAPLNQKVRWVNNKESHAQSIQDVVAQYFLAQRVKVSEAEKDAAKYGKKLALLHQITVHAMKCKQTTDTANAEM